MEDYRKDVLGNNEGVGYSEEGIVDATGSILALILKSL